MQNQWVFFIRIQTSSWGLELILALKLWSFLLPHLEGMETTDFRVEIFAFLQAELHELHLIFCLVSQFLQLGVQKNSGVPLP